MSTEDELNQEQITEQQATAGENTPENTQPDPPAESDVAWNDVPDPEDEPNEKTPSGSETAAPAEDSASDPAEPAAPTGPDDDQEDGDPFSFLDDLDEQNPTDQPADPPSSGTPPAPTENPPPAPPVEISSLDDLNLDDVISGLPDGELKEFAENYHDEAKMAAAMAVQILKKMGYDALRNDMKKYSGAAEQFTQSQQELQAKAVQNAFEEAVLKEHPDAKEIIAGNERRNFASWLKNQPKFLQQRFRSTGDPEEACDILARYKSSRDGQRSAQQKRTSRFSGVRSASSAPRGRSDEEVNWNDIKDEDVPEY